MTPALTFFIGLAIVVLFGWYFATESNRLRRILGTVLTINVTALCLWSTYPPFDEKGPDGKIVRRGKIHLGLDLQGGTSFLIRLEPPASADGGKRPITKSMVDQAIEAPTMGKHSAKAITIPGRDGRYWLCADCGMSVVLSHFL